MTPRPGPPPSVRMPEAGSVARRRTRRKLDAGGETRTDGRLCDLLSLALSYRLPAPRAGNGGVVRGALVPTAFLA
jgi:hypothetical protein